MLARTYLLRIQRNLYAQQKGYARSLLGALSPDLKKYLAEYQRDFNEFKGVTTKGELLAAVQSAHITICGDYHTLGQAQRTLIRLLRESLPPLREAGKRVVLALEMLRFRDTPLVERYFRKEITEAAFLRAIRFRKNWGFHWSNYRRLLEFARDHDIEVVGLNLDNSNRGRAASLGQRDRFAARVLADLTEGETPTAVFALIGDLHLAQAHLPKHLQAEWKRRGVQRQMTLVHQNHEGLYWKLASRRLEGPGIVRLRDRVFCVLNTPPWVKLQTYLKWAEWSASSYAEEPPRPRNYARYADELGRNKLGTFWGGENDDLDYSDEIRDLLGTIQRFLGIEGPVDDDFKIVWPSDMSFLSRLGREQGLSRFSLKVLAQCLTELESHFIPRANLIYLTSFSLNQAAAQAAVFLHSKVSQRSTVFESPKRDFYPAIWTEALAFLGSKIINPSRRCTGPAALLKLTAVPPVRGGRGRAHVAKAVIEHLHAERYFFEGRRRRFLGIRLPARSTKAARAYYYYSIARALGQILGQALYSAVLAGDIERTDIRTLFECPFSSTEAKEKYLYWCRRLDTKHYRNIVKDDRL